MDEQQGQLIVTEPRALAAVQTLPPLQPMSVKDLVTRIQQIQQIMNAVMKPMIHYGVIPGTQKPSLWRPGGEILAVTFKLSLRPQIELLVEGGEVGYRVATPTYDAHENLLTIGWGECWTNEEKFAWRAAVCPEEWEETDPGQRRKKWKLDDDGDPFTILQIRQNPSDQRNAVLKRGCKRSYLDGVIKALAASDIFDQQLEEDDQGGERPAAKAKPKAGATLQGILKSATPGKPGKVVITCEGVDLELTFFMDQAPGVLKAESDWGKLKGRPCTFSYEQRESRGRVYRNLKTITWAEAKTEPPKADQPQGSQQEEQFPEFVGDGREVA